MSTNGPTPANVLSTCKLASSQYPRSLPRKLANNFTDFLHSIMRRRTTLDLRLENFWFVSEKNLKDCNGIDLFEA